MGNILRVFSSKNRYEVAARPVLLFVPIIQAGPDSDVLIYFPSGVLIRKIRTTVIIIFYRLPRRYFQTSVTLRGAIVCPDVKTIVLNHNKPDEVVSSHTTCICPHAHSSIDARLPRNIVIICTSVIWRAKKKTKKQKQNKKKNEKKTIIVSNKEIRRSSS